MTPNIHIKQDQNRKLHQNFDSLCWSIYSIKQYIGSFKSSNHQVIKFLFVSNFITHFILSHHIFSRTNLFILAICSKVNRFYFQRYFHRLILSNLFYWYLIQMIFLFKIYFIFFFICEPVFSRKLRKLWKLKFANWTHYQKYEELDELFDVKKWNVLVNDLELLTELREQYMIYDLKE